MKKETIETLNFKNYHLKLIEKMLNIPLHSERARARNRFYKELSKKMNELEMSRKEIFERLGKVNNKEKKYEFKDPEKVNVEYSKLMKEDCIMDILPSLKADIPIIKNIILESDIPMDITETEIYEEILKEFEKGKK